MPVTIIGRSLSLRWNKEQKEREEASMTSAVVDKAGIGVTDKIVSTSESGHLLQAYLACDAASALLASFLVSPVITIIDRSIIQNASGAIKVCVFIIIALKGKASYTHIEPYTNTLMWAITF